MKNDKDEILNDCFACQILHLQQKAKDCQSWYCKVCASKCVFSSGRMKTSDKTAKRQQNKYCSPYQNQKNIEIISHLIERFTQAKVG